MLQTVHPKTTEEAQFADPEINALVDKIHVVESEGLSERYRPFMEGPKDLGTLDVSRMIVELSNGDRPDPGIVPAEPAWSGKESEIPLLEDKFRWLARYVLPEKRSEDILQMLWQFAAVQAVAEMTALLRHR